MLTRQAKGFQREEWFAAEREASGRDALNPVAMTEQELWEATDDEWD
jgi:hypothetical protein